jgi:hypothetical protein
MRFALYALVLGVFSALFFASPGTEINLAQLDVQKEEGSAITTIASTTEEAATSTEPVSRYHDIANQPKLTNPPSVIKAIYLTSWSAGSERTIANVIRLTQETEINAVVIDIKDYSGHILYDIQNADVSRYGAKDVRIPKLNSVIKKLHDAGVYVIARQTVFQDPVLAKARLDLAVQKDVLVAPAVVARVGTSTRVITATTTRRTQWLDNKDLGWIDPGAQEAWDYNIAIARDASARGFDEINFDYIRFPSDGVLSTMKFTHYAAATMYKVTQIKQFFEYLRKETEGIVISADLFGLVTVNNDDLGIGQNLKVAAPYFDVIAPMTYPSHYAKGFIGLQNPGAHPYEVIDYSLERAHEKLKGTEEVCEVQEKRVGTSTVSERVCTTETVYSKTKLRPWLQDFDLGADYDAEKVRAQINAVDENLKGTPLYNGWMLWAPSNIYTRGALRIQ